MKKVLIVCGNGLGSSFIVEMNVKKILAEMNKEAEVAHTDLTSAKSETADLILAVVPTFSSPGFLPVSEALQKVLTERGYTMMF
ncbi:PTS sugar transporter subunit IIB, partial [Klebsiella pneumoniae]